MGKGSAARPLPDRETFSKNFDAVFNSGPKPKAQIMREMRERRNNEGMTELHLWVTPQQKLAIEAILEADTAPLHQ
jgi:hypothetical protein